jgi:hypothetical protein
MTEITATLKKRITRLQVRPLTLGENVKYAECKLENSKNSVQLPAR